jgi:hypothetical protein
MLNHAHPPPPSAAASFHGAASPSLELGEARQLRDALKALLRKEQAAMADFLLALADFDRRRGWERLGHANLFAFLLAELRLSRSAAFYRKCAAELLQQFPEVVAPLREGKLCLSTVAELAKVLTEENQAVVAPRFFGLSAREAQELVAELQPRQVPSTRMVVTRVADPAAAPKVSATQTRLTLAPAPLVIAQGDAHPNVVPLSRVLTSELANGGGGRFVVRRDEIVPLTADQRRVHFNVGKQVVTKLEAAREGLSHAIPGATMEQVLEAALDLLLEKQARARGQVKRPRSVAAAAVLGGTTPSKPVEGAPATAVANGNATTSPGANEAEPGDGPEPIHRRTGPRETIPAAVKRAVWARDGGRCCWPLDGGGTCGSTHRLELDHIRPWAREGDSTVENLRVTCDDHNRRAARNAFGRRCVERYTGARDLGGSRRGRAVGAPPGGGDCFSGGDGREQRNRGP